MKPCFLNFLIIIFDVDFFKPNLSAEDFMVIFSSVTNLMSYLRVSNVIFWFFVLISSSDIFYFKFDNYYI